MAKVCAGSLLGLILLVAGGAALQAAPSADRQKELIYRLRQDCGSCHGMTLKGGLGPPLVPGAIANKDQRALVDAILNGRPGTPMPPWAFEISTAEATWLVERLKEGLGDDR